MNDQEVLTTLDDLIKKRFIIEVLRKNGVSVISGLALTDDGKKYVDNIRKDLGDEESIKIKEVLREFETGLRAWLKDFYPTRYGKISLGHFKKILSKVNFEGESCGYMHFLKTKDGTCYIELRVPRLLLFPHNW